MEYRFPEVYVKDTISKRYICLENGVYVVKNKPVNCSRVYGLIPYEEVLKYIDLAEAETELDIVILRYKPGGENAVGYFIERGAKLCLQEIKGGEIYFPLEEGSMVKKGDLIAYVVTNKLETKSIKSICKGIIALIIDMPWEEPRKAIVVVSDEYRSIDIRESKDNGV